MKTIVIKTQEEFDKLKRVEVDEEVIFEASKIRINCVLEVFGVLRLCGEIDSSSENRYVVAWESSQVHNEARASSQVHNVARASSQVHNVARESSQVHNVAWASSQVHNVAHDSSRVHQKSYNFSVSTNLGQIASLELFGSSIGIVPIDTRVKIKKSKTALVRRVKEDSGWFARNGMKKSRVVILYKRVSKDFKTQEKTFNETIWLPGATLTHPNWSPKDSECGAGKFHAVSQPYFADQFRSLLDDRYVAIEIKFTDLFEWKHKPEYPHKIGFRAGKVLYEVDRYGNKVTSQ